MRLLPLWEIYMTAEIRLLKIAEVSKILSLSEGSVRRLVKCGVLPRTEFSPRAHRFRYDHVLSALELLTTVRALQGTGINS
jgi:predicted DNA-binding transcriptional regulator AlpA